MVPKILISQDIETIKKEIETYLASHTRSGKLNHPDVLYFPAGSKLGIGEARQIKGHFSIKPYSEKGRVVVLEDASVLTDEAQNALLKILEEPPEAAVILLGAKSETDLLPTVLSRCEVVILPASVSDLVGLEPKTYEVSAKDIEKLLSSSIEERFECIEKLKDREAFLYVLIAYFREALHAPGSLLAKPDVAKFLKELLQAEEWAAQNVNIRAILEYLMLVIPTKSWYNILASERFLCQTPINIQQSKSKF